MSAKRGPPPPYLPPFLHSSLMGRPPPSLPPSSPFKYIYVSVCLVGDWIGPEGVVQVIRIKDGLYDRQKTFVTA